MKSGKHGECSISIG